GERGVGAPEGVCDRADSLGGPRDLVLRVTMTRASSKVGARSWRECRTTASTGPGQKSHVERRKASVPSLGTQDASRKIGLGCPVCANRSHAGSARGAQRTQGGFARFAQI